MPCSSRVQWESRTVFGKPFLWASHVKVWQSPFYISTRLSRSNAPGTEWNNHILQNTYSQRKPRIAKCAGSWLPWPLCSSLRLVDSTARHYQNVTLNMFVECSRNRGCEEVWWKLRGPASILWTVGKLACNIFYGSMQIRILRNREEKARCFNSAWIGGNYNI